MITLRRWFAGSIAVLALTSAGRAQEPGPQPYSQSGFVRAQAGGGMILIETYAYWCLACRIQAPILAQLRESGPFRSTTVFRIDETTPDAIWRRFHLRGYGTIVVFRGKCEVARGTPTTREAVADLLGEAL